MPACQCPRPRYLAKAKQQGLHRAAKVVHVFLKLVGTVLPGQGRAQLGPATTATVRTGPPGVPWTSWSSPVPHTDGGRLPAGPTHRKAGVHDSKLPCQTQVHGAAQGVPEPLAHGLHDGGHVAPFELTAESAGPVSWGPETGPVAHSLRAPLAAPDYIRALPLLSGGSQEVPR